MLSTDTCAICGTSSERPVIISTNSFGGGPDLDGRPGPLARYTMIAWLAECPECGYVSSRVSDPPGKITKEWLKSEEYRRLGGMRFNIPGEYRLLAERFYRQGLCLLKNNNISGAFNAFLHAAWVCDDATIQEHGLSGLFHLLNGQIKKYKMDAAECRKAAIRLAGQVIPKNKEEKNNLLLVKADMMRRAGMFDELAAEYGGLETGDPETDKILDFHLKKAKEKDTECYVRHTLTRRFGSFHK